MVEADVIMSLSSWHRHQCQLYAKTDVSSSAIAMQKDVDLIVPNILHKRTKSNHRRSSLLDPLLF